MPLRRKKTKRDSMLLFVTASFGASKAPHYQVPQHLPNETFNFVWTLCVSLTFITTFFMVVVIIIIIILIFVVSFLGNDAHDDTFIHVAASSSMRIFRLVPIRWFVFATAPPPPPSSAAHCRFLCQRWADRHQPKDRAAWQKKTRWKVVRSNIEKWN